MTRTEILNQFPPSQDNLLLILHALQDSNPHNYLTADVLRQVAAYLNTTTAAVYGVATYYSLFSVTPRGRHIVRACISPVCQMLSGENVVTHLHRTLGIDIAQTTSDGLFTLEQSACLGCCEKAPAMMIDGAVFGSLTTAKITSLIARLREDAV